MLTGLHFKYRLQSYLLMFPPWRLYDIVISYQNNSIFLPVNGSYENLSLKLISKTWKIIAQIIYKIVPQTHIFDLSRLFGTMFIVHREGGGGRALLLQFF